jgi:MFS family permease
VTSTGDGDSRGPRRRSLTGPGGEGGVRQVLAGTTANLAVGTLFAWSLVAEDAAADVGITDSAAATVFSGAIVVFTAVVLGTGAAERRYGPRRLLDAAALAGGTGLVVAGTANGALALWCGIAVFFGIANGLAYGVATGLAARAPEPGRGTATGIVVAAYAAGPLVLGFIAPTVLRRVGWRPALVGLGLIVCGLLILAARLAPARRGGGGSLREPVERVPWGVVALGWFLFAGGAAPGLMLFADAASLAVDLRLSPRAAALAVSALAAGNVTGRLAAGWWSDRVGRLPALAAALSTAAVSVVGLVPPVAPVVVLAAFLGSGLAYGAVSSLVPAVTADLVGAGAFSVVYRRIFTGWGFAGLCAPVAGSQLLSVRADHPALLGLVAAPLMPAGVALLVATRWVPGGRRT